MCTEERFTEVFGRRGAEPIEDYALRRILGTRARDNTEELKRLSVGLALCPSICVMRLASANGKVQGGFG